MSTILKILLILIKTIQIWIQINFDMTLSKIHKNFKYLIIILFVNILTVLL